MGHNTFVTCKAGLTEEVVFYEGGLSKEVLLHLSKEVLLYSNEYRSLIHLHKTTHVSSLTHEFLSRHLHTYVCLYAYVCGLFAAREGFSTVCRQWAVSHVAYLPSICLPFPACTIGPSCTLPE